MREAQIQQIENLLQRAEMSNASKELMRKFFNSIVEQPQFNKIMDLLNRFPSLFENFCKCFELKRELKDSGMAEDKWNELVISEKNLLDTLVE